MEITQKTIIEFGLIFALLILAGSLIFNSFKACDVNIDYDVEIDSISNNTQINIAEVKLACYKLCMDELGRSEQFRYCLEKCEALK